MEADISKIEKMAAGHMAQGTLSLGDPVAPFQGSEGALSPASMATATGDAAPEATPPSVSPLRHPVSAPVSEVVVRLAEPADADAIAGLSQELLAFYGLPSKHPRAYLGHMIQKYALVENSGLEVLIATRRDRTLGFLAYSHTFAIAACRRTFFIQDIFVTRRERTRGIGRAMMSALAAIAQERGIDQIDWTTDPWNTKAKRFYDSMDSLLKGEKIFYRMVDPSPAAMSPGSGD